MINKKFINQDEAKTLINNAGEEFALVKNPDYVFPPFEIYPLAPRLKTINNLTAVVMDMDGTTTTTEELCIHSLEFMVRKMNGNTEAGEGIRLDEVKDYPNIIGNSTTKHVEYLINTYKEKFNEQSIVKAYIYAALWALKFGKDANRKEEVKASLKGFGLGELTGEDFIKNLSAGEQKLTLDNCEINNLAEKYGGRFSGFSVSELVRVGIDIYYQRYHEILEKIKTGSGGRIADELFGVTDKRLIEPMPGVLFFLSLVKGWIGEKDEKIIDEFVESYSEGNAAAVKNLKTLAGRFRKAPARLAIVTSSIFYEADIVMTEVFKLLKEEVSKFPFSENTKAFLEDKFAHYNNVYDAFLTASDSSEIRLKPHRDLYSIALHRLSVPKAKFNEVIGFEDSESGTIAIRAAGVGCCVAVPFAQTAGHDLSAAAYTCPAGLPEALVQHNLFFNE